MRRAVTRRDAPRCTGSADSNGLMVALCGGHRVHRPKGGTQTSKCEQSPASAYPPVGAVASRARHPEGVRDREGRTDLHYAALNDDADRARALLASGADPDAADLLGLT